MVDYKSKCQCYTQYVIVNMWNLLTGIFILLCLTDALEAKWEYELLEAHINSSDSEQVETALEIVLISRGVSGLDGVFDLKVNINDDWTVKVDIYRSVSGAGDWITLPYAYPKSSIIKFFNTMYRNAIMESMKECSNLPILEKDWQGPFPMGNYKMHECKIKTDNLPSYLLDSYYKVQAFIEGTANLYLELLVKLENKI